MSRCTILGRGNGCNNGFRQKSKCGQGNTGKRYRQVIRDFTASLGKRATLALAHITSKDVFDYRKSILDAGKTARTANLSLKVVSSAFNAALRQGYITTNPCTALESLPFESKEKGTFTPAQMSKLVGRGGRRLEGCILLAYYTGARLRDMANMRWSAVDLTRQFVTFTPSKTKKPVTIPLHSELERHLLKREKVVVFRQGPLTMLAGGADVGRGGVAAS